MANQQPQNPAPHRRGGRRPGAGAPKGNLNALKHGANSRQLQQLAIALAIVPEARQGLARLVRRHRRQQAQARNVAVKLLANLLRACLHNLEGDNQPLGGTITLVSNPDRPIRSPTNHHFNQPPQSNRPDQSNPPVGQGPSPAAS